MYYRQSSTLTKKRFLPHGFSLIELLVSISIIAIVVGIVIVRNNAFEGAVLLRNQTYAVAMAFREAQLLAVSGAGETSRLQLYGVHIDITPNVGNNREVIIFADTAGGAPNGRYDRDIDQIIDIIRLDQRFEISHVRVGSSYSNRQISSTMFQRPNYDAKVCLRINISCFHDDMRPRFASGNLVVTISRAGTTGTGPSDRRTITVTPTGQISVSN